MEPRPTLEDVARRAGVGKTTASLAMRNNPKISAATRARVQQAAEELHYRPDPALSRIAAYRWRSREHPSDFALAYVTTNHPDLKRELTPEARLAATAQAERLGYQVQHFRLEDYLGPEQLCRVLYHRGIRGVVVGQVFREELVRNFRWEQFSSVGADIGYFRPPVNVVMPDFLHSMVRIWREARQAGYRRIGVAMLQELKAIDLLDKVSAALYCQTQLDTATRPVPVGFFPLDDRREFRTWLRRHRPDLVIGFNNTVHWWLQEEGHRVPEDVGFISLMLERRSESDHSLAGMITDVERIGRTAIEQVDILLRTNQVGIPERPLLVQVPGIWFPGLSMAQPAAADAPPEAEPALPR